MFVRLPGRALRVLSLAAVLLTGHSITTNAETILLPRPKPPVKAAGMMINYDYEQPLKVAFVKPSIAVKAKVVSRIDIDMNDKRQPVFGFGANLTQASVRNINRLKPEARTYALRRLFSKKDGYGLDYLRVPIGASDFSDPTDMNRSYNDLPAGETDFKLERFDMSWDHETFALLKEILAINPDIKLMLTAWTAPGWMKDSGSLQGGWLKDDTHQVYADYLIRALVEYKNRGFKIDAMTMVNEPGVWWHPFTCMGMSHSQQGKILSQYLGPKLRKVAPEVKMLALDHNWGMWDWVRQQFEEYPRSRDYTDGIAFHCYGGEVADQSKARAQFPGLLIYQTECSPYETTPKTKRYYFGWWIDVQIIEGARHGSSVSLGWNLVLDQYYGPHQSFCRHCRGLLAIDNKEGIVTNEYPELRALGLGSKYTGPGTHVVASRSSDEELGAAAYLNADGARVVVARNKSKTLTKTVLVRDTKGAELAFELPPEHAVSIRWK